MKKIITTYTQFLENHSTIDNIDLFNRYSKKWEDQFPVLGKFILQTDITDSYYEWDYSKEFSYEKTEGKIELGIKSDGHTWGLDFKVYTEEEPELWMGVVDKGTEDHSEKKEQIKKEGLLYEAFLKSIAELVPVINKYIKNIE